MKGKATVGGCKKEVAIKKFNVTFSSKLLIGEFKTLRSLKHENIVSLYDYIPQERTIVLELCSVQLEEKTLFDLRQWAQAYKDRSQYGDLQIFAQITVG